MPDAVKNSSSTDSLPNQLGVQFQPIGVSCDSDTQYAQALSTCVLECPHDLNLKLPKAIARFH